MASVVREFLDFSDEEFELRSVTTWVPGDGALRGMTRALAASASILLTRKRPSVVHAHLSEGGSFIREGLVVGLSRAIGARTVVTLHGAKFPEFADRHPTIVRRVLGTCDVVIVLGPKQRDLIEKVGVVSRIVPMLNPVGSDQSARTDQTSTPAVVVAGEVGTRKGTDLLLAAWSIVRAEIPEVRCWVVGPRGEGAPSLADLAEAGVDYKGALSANDCRKLMKAAWLGVLPSRQEVLPMFLLECLADGVPIVASDAGEIGQLVSCAAAAILANVDGDSLAAMIIDRLSVLTDPAVRADMALAASTWSAENTSEVAIKSRLFDAYRLALSDA